MKLIHAWGVKRESKYIWMRDWEALLKSCCHRIQMNYNYSIWSCHLVLLVLWKRVTKLCKRVLLIKGLKWTGWIWLGRKRKVEQSSHWRRQRKAKKQWAFMCWPLEDQYDEILEVVVEIWWNKVWMFTRYSIKKLIKHFCDGCSAFLSYTVLLPSRDNTALLSNTTWSTLKGTHLRLLLSYMQ